jgi:hypothetical protein
MAIFIPYCSGCATAKPYVEVGVGYQINQLSDWWYSALEGHPKGNQIGQPWMFQGEAGFEFPKNWSCAWQHESHLLDGGPFNNNPELYREMIICSKKFGGIK